jgi:drug/metabolite transporter (DMT)-like permease
MPVSSFLLLTIFSFFAAITLAIGTIFEYLAGNLVLPSPLGILAIFYSGVMASLVGQLLFVRGVRSIGSNRAGLYLNMVPVFGAIMAVMFLGEHLQRFHFISALFVLSGIYLVERYKLN